MRGKSHICLGKYLSEKYMTGASRLHIQAFLVGCIEPDRNPATYLKGSVRSQWLRGHNYQNAQRFISRICSRLGNKEQLNLFDYYTLGKLIHYTADAFTYAHNDAFPANLEKHRKYEAALQEHFLRYLRENPDVRPYAARSIMEAIRHYRTEYEKESGDIRTDSRFALAACCCVMAVLFAKPALQL